MGPPIDTDFLWWASSLASCASPQACGDSLSLVAARQPVELSLDLGHIGLCPTWSLPMPHERALAPTYVLTVASGSLRAKLRSIQVFEWEYGLVFGRSSVFTSSRTANEKAGDGRYLSRPVFGRADPHETCPRVGPPRWWEFGNRLARTCAFCPLPRRRRGEIGPQPDGIQTWLPQTGCNKTVLVVLILTSLKTHAGF